MPTDLTPAAAVAEQPWERCKCGHTRGDHFYTRMGMLCKPAAGGTCSCNDWSPPPTPPDAGAREQCDQTYNGHQCFRDKGHDGQHTNLHHENWDDLCTFRSYRQRCRLLRGHSGACSFAPEPVIQRLLATIKHRKECLVAAERYHDADIVLSIERLVADVLSE